MGVVYVGVCALRCLKEELIFAAVKQVRTVVNKTITGAEEAILHWSGKISGNF